MTHVQFPHTSGLLKAFPNFPPLLFIEKKKITVSTRGKRDKEVFVLADFKGGVDTMIRLRNGRGWRVIWILGVCKEKCLFVTELFLFFEITRDET